MSEGLSEFEGYRYEPPVRRCAYGGCTVKLSVLNKGTMCFRHTEEMATSRRLRMREGALAIARNDYYLRRKQELAHQQRTALLASLPVRFDPVTLSRLCRAEGCQVSMTVGDPNIFCCRHMVRGVVAEQGAGVLTGSETLLHEKEARP